MKKEYFVMETPIHGVITVRQQPVFRKIYAGQDSYRHF